MYLLFSLRFSRPRFNVIWVSKQSYCRGTARHRRWQVAAHNYEKKQGRLIELTGLIYILRAYVDVVLSTYLSMCVYSSRNKHRCAMFWASLHNNI